MDNQIAALSARVQTLRTEVEVRNRRRAEEASKAKKGLDTINDEDIDLLAPIVPGLRVIKQYSLEDIKENTNGAIDNIKKVMDELRKYTEQRLTYYEGQL